ncbi:hypothetical protein [Humisphaera borealis]|uniref:Uncharacterized protein n=1 Tax=Humisphaera borealis TaxID=2807512 RepID=A0A7M2WS54_9BACT|nr:hypothetical protein [Humisphaera borealis]QOV88273.1 hypothetical protein IPV69_18720 [Humisphaera borealis]
MPPNESTSASQGRIIQETPGAPRGPFPRHYTGDPSHDAAYLDQLNEFFGGEVSTSSPNAGWSWYEAELYGGALFGLGPATFDLKYSARLYPGGDVASYQEISGKLSLETAQWLAKSAITPQSLRPYAELSYQVAGSDGHDMYLELGLEPTWLVPVGDKLLGISTPVLAGLSLSDYYLDQYGRNETLGYLSAGVKLSLRLSSSPAGDVYLNASVNYLRLESDLLVLANDGRQDAVVGTLGVSYSR